VGVGDGAASVWLFLPPEPELQPAVSDAATSKANTA